LEPDNHLAYPRHNATHNPPLPGDLGCSKVPQRTLKEIDEGRFSSDDSTPGWFGKIAGLGDFVHRRLSTATVQALDDWLSKCMEVSHIQLGERWLPLYLSCCVWRFAWAPGVLGNRWWFGVLMPSIDNVGRHYPLIIAQPSNTPPHTTESLQQLEKWFAYVTHAALGTLVVGSTLKQFEADLMRTPQLPQPVPAPAVLHGSIERWADRTRQELEGGAPLELCLQQMAVNEVLQRLQACCIWWPVRRNGRMNSMSMSHTVGLPSPEIYIQMLEDTW
jgi:type VI secretion system protein ImpM